ncbi:glycerol-3-phosphate 1-O-acyltransferase PlsY [Nitratidesulfovibrio vulgaris]|uniref:glycerol-3-phosphate 1-O-acyltransferase PlsY n=1 Tax=Nitratidesulfovibrio vulgaris TaxID=881 RepID=UPI0013DF3752|nr:glycerol-3-phosphate 1-O-acyltransferase PlsY [Nitratidesulfovibrio vulgaris]
MGSLLWLAVAYVMGSIPFGLLFAKMFCGTDPRTGGSRNVGATNVARLCGTKVGVLTLVCDALKGAIPVAVALSISDSTVFHSLTALAALLGHLYSCFLSFKGGKAVATTVGVFLPLAFWPLVLSGIACLAVIWRSGFVSLGSLTLVTAMPAMLLLGGHWKLVPLALVVMVLVYWSHRENIGRLSRGEEKPWQKKHHDAAQGTDAGAAPEAAADAAHAGTVDCGCDCGCDAHKPSTEAAPSQETSDASAHGAEAPVAADAAHAGTVDCGCDCGCDAHKPSTEAAPSQETSDASAHGAEAPVAADEGDKRENEEHDNAPEASAAESKPEDKPAGKTVGKPASRSVAKPASKSAGKTGGKAADKSAGKSGKSSGQ